MLFANQAQAAIKDNISSKQGIILSLHNIRVVVRQLIILSCKFVSQLNRRLLQQA